MKLDFNYNNSARDLYLKSNIESYIRMMDEEGLTPYKERIYTELLYISIMNNPKKDFIVKDSNGDFIEDNIERSLSFMRSELGLIQRNMEGLTKDNIYSEIKIIFKELLYSLFNEDELINFNEKEIKDKLNEMYFEFSSNLGSLSLRGKRYMNIVFFDILEKFPHFEYLLKSSKTMIHSFIIELKQIYTERTGKHIDLMDKEYSDVSESIIIEMEEKFNNREELLQRMVDEKNNIIDKLIQENMELTNKISEYENVEIDLKGRTILLVGPPDRISDYKSIIEDYNGKMEHLDPFESGFTKIKSDTQKADYVLHVTSYSSHAALDIINKYVPKENYLPINNMNLSNFNESLKVISHKEK